MTAEEEEYGRYFSKDANVLDKDFAQRSAFQFTFEMFDLSYSICATQNFC